MSVFINSLASSLLASSILISGLKPVLAQYSCPPREIQSVHEVDDFKFELKSCQRFGKKVTCSLWVTDTKRDANEAVVFNDTRLVDTSGEQYKPPVSSDAYLSFVKDVPMKISVIFMDVPTSVQDIALFEIRIGGGSPYKGQFRNIKIMESKIDNSPSTVKKKK